MKQEANETLNDIFFKIRWEAASRRAEYHFFFLKKKTWKN